MADLIAVEIGRPHAQWMTLAFSSANQEFREEISSRISPFLQQLIGALRVLRDGGYVGESIWLLLEPEECELQIRAEANSPIVELRVEKWPDHRRSSLSPPRRTVFSVQGPREKLISPFVEALRRLRTTVGDAEFEREYGSPFPKTEFDRLAGSP
jgi:hypothetical protein